MSALTLFGKPSKALAVLGGVEDSLTSTIAGGSAGGNRRISIKGGVFREIVGGKEVRVSEDRAINVVIINAAPVSRMYFSGTYNEGEISKPVCWSSDTQRPDSAVPQDQRQSQFCKDCPQHIKGSGQGESRACRFQQRIAVLLDGEIDKREVYQVTLPSTSVFGDADGKKMPLQAYGRHLKAYNTPAISIITEMRFDTASPTPKLVFKPVRELEEHELQIAVEMKDHADTVKAVSLNVSQMDGVIPAPKQEAKPTPAPALPPATKAAKAAPVEVEEVEEPKKVVKKTAATSTPEEKVDLSAVVDEWDD
jgi:hypothetical protein